jgi:hypothetical protein
MLLSMRLMLSSLRDSVVNAQTYVVRCCLRLLPAVLFQSSAYEGFLDWLMPIDDVNRFVGLLLLLTMGRSVFPMNGLLVVYESGAFSPICLFPSLLSAAAAGAQFLGRNAESWLFLCAERIVLRIVFVFDDDYC